MSVDTAAIALTIEMTPPTMNIMQPALTPTGLRYTKNKTKGHLNPKRNLSMQQSTVLSVPNPNAALTTKRCPHKYRPWSSVDFISLQYHSKAFWMKDSIRASPSRAAHLNTKLVCFPTRCWFAGRKK